MVRLMPYQVMHMYHFRYTFMFEFDTFMFILGPQFKLNDTGEHINH